MKALTIILRIRTNYENAYTIYVTPMLQAKHNVNAYIIHSECIKTITSTL